MSMEALKIINRNKDDLAVLKVLRSEICDGTVTDAKGNEMPTRKGKVVTLAEMAAAVTPDFSTPDHLLGC